MNRQGPSQLRTKFQFHTGSIKSKKEVVRTLRGYTGFNSILVRLKVSCKPKQRTLMTKFQFHTGSIKSVWAHYRQRSAGMFQFHTGSIKRVSHLQESNQGAGFNSILVRLKADYESNIAAIPE